jgi:hypothetical protein
MLSDTCDIAAHGAVAEAEPETQPEHRGPGRPPIITLPVVEKVARLIAMGLVEEQACLRVGVNHSSFRTACHRNAEFETAKKKAQADFLDEALSVIASGKKGWQGLAWILERRHGEQFRRTTGMELSGHVGPYSMGDLLAKKPLGQWTRADVDASVGAWPIFRKWSAEQLKALNVRYEMEWGSLDDDRTPGDWSDEKVEWSYMLISRAVELETGKPIVPIGTAIALLEAAEAHKSRKEMVAGEPAKAEEADLSTHGG